MMLMRDEKGRYSLSACHANSQQCWQRKHTAMGQEATDFAVDNRSAVAVACWWMLPLRNRTPTSESPESDESNKLTMKSEEKLFFEGGKQLGDFFMQHRITCVFFLQFTYYRFIVLHCTSGNTSTIVLGLAFHRCPIQAHHQSGDRRHRWRWLIVRAVTTAHHTLFLLLFLQSSKAKFFTRQSINQSLFNSILASIFNYNTFIRLFWNQILICLSDSPVFSTNCVRCNFDTYRLARNSSSNVRFYSNIVIHCQISQCWPSPPSHSRSLGRDYTSACLHSFWTMRGDLNKNKFGFDDLFWCMIIDTSIASLQTGIARIMICC